MAGLEGQSISEFQILSKLGQGGMGTVYLARQSSLNRSVAIKILPTHLAEDETFIQRFRREGTAAASFSHPDIVQVFAAGEFNGVHYIAMEYVDGESLQKRLSREGRIPPTEALAIAVHVAQALSYAWQKAQLIHRDIKPSNILISNEGHVKLADLGMVKCLSDDASQLTSTGSALGTPYYVSPEQARARPDIDFRADIYSLGCTLYHMLTGQTPYEGGDSVAVILKQVSDPPPNILEIMPDCPPTVAMLLNKMLAKDRDQRQQSYDELIAEMFAAHDQIPQQPVSVPKPRSQKWNYAVAASAIIIAIAGTLVWSPWKNSTSRQLQVKLPAKTEQRPQNAAAALSRTDVSKAEIALSSSAFDKPVGNTAPSAQPQSSAKTSDRSNSPSSRTPTDMEGSTLPSKSAATLPIIVQQPPLVAAANTNHGTVATHPEQSHLTAVTAASTPIRNVDDPVRTAPDANKNVHPVRPVSAPSTESRVTDNETAFLKSVAALPPEQQVTRVMARIKELNPQFDGKEQHRIENSAVTELAFSTAGVTNIVPINALKWLKKLSITPSGTNQTGTISDLTPLQGLPLTWLWCHQNPISDLSPLRGMPLTVLSCGGTQIKDLAPLAGMKLTVLSFNDTEVADLAPLEGMPLTVLWCNNTKVTDLSLLKTMPLQELKCNFVAERDATVLRSIKMLAKINDRPAAAFLAGIGPTAGRLPSTGSAQKTVTTAIAVVPSGSEKTIHTTTDIELIWIPPGDFLQGSTQEEQRWATGNGSSASYVKYEGTGQRKATVKQGFWLGRTEVTVGQWKRFINTKAYVTDAETLGHAYTPMRPDKGWGMTKGSSWKDPRFNIKLMDNHPVCCISWNDAMAFCHWLTEVEQRANKLPSGMVYRLPTEAEWEHACRAGTQTSFWWGDKVQGGDRRINWAGIEDGFEFVSPVDHYKARGRNKFGLADMLGNVWEWCLDGLDTTQAHNEYYKGDPTGRQLRGGAFNRNPGDCRCAFRRALDPSYADSSNGFRICCGILH